MTTKGKWNVCFGAVGIPESGKSTWLIGHVVKIAALNRCWVIAHDPDRRIPPQLPDGTPVRTVHHASEAALLQAMKADPGGVHCLDVEDAMMVVDLGVRLAAASLRQNGGQRGTPVLIYIDEAIKVRDMGPHAPPHRLLSVITGRRHANVGIVWGSQSPQFVHNQVIGQGNELAMFRINHGLALKNLRMAGVPDDVVDRLPHLPQYECVIHKFGF